MAERLYTPRRNRLGTGGTRLEHNDRVEQTLYLPLKQANYFSELAESIGMTRQQFLEWVMTQMYAGEARHVYLIERAGVTLTIHAPRGNDFTLYQIGVRFDHRFPWLEDDELDVVRHARDIGATVGIDEAHKYLTDYGFTVTRSGDDPDTRYQQRRKKVRGRR